MNGANSSDVIEASRDETEDQGDVICKKGEDHHQETGQSELNPQSEVVVDERVDSGKGDNDKNEGELEEVQINSDEVKGQDEDGTGINHDNSETLDEKSKEQSDDIMQGKSEETGQKEVKVEQEGNNGGEASSQDDKRKKEGGVQVSSNEVKGQDDVEAVMDQKGNSGVAETDEMKKQGGAEEETITTPAQSKERSRKKSKTCLVL